MDVAHTRRNSILTFGHVLPKNCARRARGSRRSGCSSRSARGRRHSPTASRSAVTGVVGGRDGEPRHLRTRESGRPRQGDGACLPDDVGEAPRPADRRRRPRGGYFYGIELVKDKATRETFDPEESERLLRGFLSKALFEAGLYCRADDRGDPVVQLAPPPICGQSEFDEMEQILRDVLTEAWSHVSN
jgi:hypothetical protein